MKGSLIDLGEPTRGGLKGGLRVTFESPGCLSSGKQTHVEMPPLGRHEKALVRTQLGFLIFEFRLGTET